MLAGYMRGRKADGGPEATRERNALLAAGVDPQHLYGENASSRGEYQPGLTACLKALRRGDRLIVWKLDWLGRNLRHLVTTVHDLTRRGIGVKVMAEDGIGVDTIAASGELIARVFAALATFEREKASEKMKSGFAAARGRRRGSPFKLTPAKLQRISTAMRDPKVNVTKLCAKEGITRQLLYRHVAPDGTLREDGKNLLTFQKAAKVVERQARRVARVKSGTVVQLHTEGKAVKKRSVFPDSTEAKQGMRH